MKQTLEHLNQWSLKNTTWITVGVLSIIDLNTIWALTMKIQKSAIAFHWALVISIFVGVVFIFSVIIVTITMYFSAYPEGVF